MRFTVFTPAYNRAHTLTRLYESLKRQSLKDFEWLVVDDGSTDNTEELIQSFIDEKPFFEINYIKTENGGKHRAINRGMPYARGELTFLLDSDDWLTDDSLEIIDTEEKKILDEKKDGFVSISGLKLYSNGTPIGKTFEGDHIEITYLERGRNGISGDKGEVFYTDILKKYPFPEFEGEKFATERLVWNEMAKDGYKIRYFNKPVQYCEYLEDGLTAGGYSMYARYPKQWGLAIWQDYHYGKRGVKRLYYNTIQIYVYYLFTKKTLSVSDMAKCLKTSPINVLGSVFLQSLIDIPRLIKNKGIAIRSQVKE